MLVFFGANAAAGIYVATAVFMAVTLVALAAAWWRYHKLPLMLLVSAVVVMVFGTLTLYLRDDTFIKLKPTIVYLTFAVFLGVGLLLRKPVLELLLGSVFNLTEPGWRKLTARWAVFFIAMAVLNELVWRNVSTDTWVSFKAFGFLPLTFLFAVSQMPLMQRHAEPPHGYRRANLSACVTLLLGSRLTLAGPEPDTNMPCSPFLDSQGHILLHCLQPLVCGSLV